ncbi:MAG: NAD(P)/FAD-dependent oxidoreductase [Acidimicrobiales bacterium]
MTERPVVVVVGAGFGGLAACKELMSASVEVVVIDRHNFNTFQPLLYQVATGGLNPGDIAYPVRSFIRRHANLTFRQETVTAVDSAASRVEIAEGEPISFDYLVLAVGAATSYFGVPGAEENSHAIYTMEDAVVVRDKLAKSIERAASRGTQPGDLTVVIVGGGATGVEMAGTLAELRRMQLETTYAGISPAEVRVVLVEQADRLLTPFAPRLSSYAGQALRARGVEVRCGESVAEVAPDHVTLRSGEAISCRLVIWAAGVGASALTQSLDVPKLHGRIGVGPDLRVSGHDNIFAIGDAAAALDGHPLAQLAQPAMQEGRHAGKQIAALIGGKATAPFRYKDKGTMATIGRRSAVAEISFGIKLRGTLAWLAWLGLHIVVLVGLRNRISVLLNWGWRYLSWRRVGRVIAGSD